MLIAGPRTRAPYPVHDLPSAGAFDPHAETPHARLLARAATFHLATHDDSARRQIEYITGRLRRTDTLEPGDARMLADRLADIIRPRRSGAFG